MAWILPDFTYFFLQGVKELSDLDFGIIEPVGDNYGVAD